MTAKLLFYVSVVILFGDLRKGQFFEAYFCKFAEYLLILLLFEIADSLPMTAKILASMGKLEFFVGFLNFSVSDLQRTASTRPSSKSVTPFFS